MGRISQRLEIQGLAEELGVSRATAYRWAGGNTDVLTGRVVARLIEATWARLMGETRHLKGWDRVLEAERRGFEYITTHGPYREFIGSDGERALRIVAGPGALPQQVNVRLTQELLEEEARAGNLRLPVDAHTLAYALVRIGESFLYADLIAGEAPDMDKAMEVVRLLCRPR